MCSSSGPLGRLAGLGASSLRARQKSCSKPLMSDWLILILLLLALLSLPFALACAVFFYRTETAYFGWFAYSLILLISAVVAYLLGLSVGIDLACVRYPSGNLCGLFGFLVIGL